MKTLKFNSLISTFFIIGLLSSNLYAADGGEIYNTYCAVCHKSGLNAAPKYGKKALWVKRVAQGKETVYKHAIEGLRGMPPRGGIATLSDDDVKAAVDYLVGRSGGWGK